MGERIGSLFSGAGGLDLAVQAVFGGDVVWHAEIDKAASRVLAHRFPGVPNLGSVTDIDWAAVPAVDVICGGFPCTDVSAAGKRAGMHGTRSGLWSHMAEAIDVLRPRHVVIENVRGLLNANANRPMESPTDDLGNGSDRPVLRAIGAVLGDLADIGGYEARWVTVAAADIGAPHRRERVFILAHAESTRWSLWDTANVGAPYREIDAFADDCGPASDSSRNGRDEGENGVALLPTPSTHDKTGARSPESIARMDKPFANLNDTTVNELSGVALLPTPTAVQGRNETSGRSNPDSCHHTGTTLHDVVFKGEIGSLLPTPNASDGSGGGQHPDKREGHSRQLIDYVLAPSSQWGKYEPAIRRWEALVGPAPAPTEPNKNGNPRLSATFSEWLMGWPASWVTDPAIGISRNDQLRIIGNGVCPQQAIAALQLLLRVSEVTA